MHSYCTVIAQLLHILSKYFHKLILCFSCALFSFYCYYLFIYLIITKLKFCACAIITLGVF